MNVNDSTLQAQLDLLQQMYTRSVINEATYRAQLEALGVAPETILVSPPPPDLSALRLRLERLDDP